MSNQSAMMNNSTWLSRLNKRWLSLIAFVFCIWGINAYRNKLPELPPWFGLGTSEIVIDLNKTSDIFGKKLEIEIPAKSLWDFLELAGIIIIPVSIVFLGYEFDKKQRQRDYEHEKSDIFQKYLEDISQLLVNNEIYNSQPRDTIQYLAEMKTKVIIRRLENDHNRQETIFLFLLDSNLMPYIFNSDKYIYKVCSSFDDDDDDDNDYDLVAIDRLKFETWNLEKVNIKESIGQFKIDNWNLENIKLKEIDLNGIYFKNANLKNANFKGASLKEANLKNACLRNANFKNANLINSKFRDADLTGVSFEEAILEGANLKESNLKNACLRNANLRNANLKNVKNITLEQIKEAINWELAKYNPELRTKLGLSSKEVESYDEGQKTSVNGISADLAVYQLSNN